MYVTALPCRSMSSPQNPFIEYPAKYRAVHGGDAWEFAFPNGWGASVARHRRSRGGTSGMWEFAVLDRGGKACYSTLIRSDAIGYLGEDNVRQLLREVAGAPHVDR
jgi:hypothetical protein